MFEMGVAVSIKRQHHSERSSNRQPVQPPHPSGVAVNHLMLKRHIQATEHGQHSQHNHGRQMMVRKDNCNERNPKGNGNNDCWPVSFRLPRCRCEMHCLQV